MRAVVVVIFIAVAYCGPIFLDIGSSGTKIPPLSGAQLDSGAQNTGSFGVGGDFDKDPPNAPKNRGMAGAAVADLRPQFSFTISDKGKVHAGDTEEVSLLPKDTVAKKTGVLDKYLEHLVKTLVKLKANPENPLVALATAGMRVPSLHDVMGEVCHKTLPTVESKTFKWAEGADWCGTIAGTDEAWYEWLATLRDSRKVCVKMENGNCTKSTEQTVSLGGPRAIVSMGGASAQMAIPLTATTYKAWLTFENETSDNWVSTKTHPLPKDKDDNPIDNFIDHREVKDVPYWNKLGISSTGPKGIVAVGLISFLALAGAERTAGGLQDDAGVIKHVAGGTGVLTDVLKEFVITKPPKDGGCEGEDWTKCLEASKKLLMKDPLFKNVVQFLRTNKLNQIPFAFISKIDLTFSDTRRDKNNSLSKSDLEADNLICSPREQKVDIKTRQNGEVSSQSASTAQIWSYNSDVLNQCTDLLIADHITKACQGTPAQWTAKYGKTACNGPCGDCINNLGRIAMIQLIFGGPSYDKAVPDQSRSVKREVDACTGKKGTPAETRCDKYSTKEACNTDAENTKDTNKCVWMVTSKTFTEGPVVDILQFEDGKLALWTSGAELAFTFRKTVQKTDEARCTTLPACEGKSAQDSKACSAKKNVACFADSKCKLNRWGCFGTDPKDDDKCTKLKQVECKGLCSYNAPCQGRSESTCKETCKWINPKQSAVSQKQVIDQKKVSDRQAGTAKQACTHPGQYQEVCAQQHTKEECWSYTPKVCLWAGKPRPNKEETDLSQTGLFGVDGQKKKDRKRYRKRKY